MQSPPECQSCGKLISGDCLSVGDLLFHAQCFRCQDCGKIIEGPYNDKAGSFYHPQCYLRHMGMVCAHCGKVLGGATVTSGKDKYHQDCFLSHIAPKCAVCGLALESRFVKDPWGNAFHAAHDGKQTPSCHFCFRVISEDTSQGGGKSQSSDIICGICQKTVVYSSAKDLAVRDVRGILASRGVTGLPGDIPVTLVSREKLFSLRGQTHSPDTQGFARTRVTETSKNRTTDHHIFVLRGIPLLTFKMIVAHELMHTWQNEHGIRLPEIQEEGLSELGASWVLEGEQTRHAEILLEAMERNQDTVYGRGFSLMKSKSAKAGSQNFLGRILLKEQLQKK